MPYSLRRTRDGAGDSGHMSTGMRINPEKPGEVEYAHDARPTVGWELRVGSIYARTYSPQDWWQTTPVTEILEETEDYVRFKTGNSEYEWRVI